MRQTYFYYFLIWEQDLLLFVATMNDLILYLTHDLTYIITIIQPENVFQ